MTAGGTRPGPNFVESGWADEIYFFVVRRDNPDPMVRFAHRIATSQDTVVAEYAVEELPGTEYYRGPVADGETLKEEAQRTGRIARAAVLERFHQKLSRTLRDRE